VSPRTASSERDLPTMRFPLVTTSYKPMPGIFTGGMKDTKSEIRIKNVTTKSLARHSRNQLGKSFTTKVAKDTKVWGIISLNFVLFVSFVVRWIFLIERGYLRTQGRKICASFANCELLQYKGRMVNRNSVSENWPQRRQSAQKNRIRAGFKTRPLGVVVSSERRL
jgi:hypothetical protein